MYYNELDSFHYHATGIKGEKKIYFLKQKKKKSD